MNLKTNRKIFLTIFFNKDSNSIIKFKNRMKVIFKTYMKLIDKFNLFLHLSSI